MSAFEVNLTAAGYAAFVNPDNTGTNAVKVETIGVTAQAFAASSATVVLPNEIKRISTIAGIAIANNVIHVTMIDNTADEYDLRGFSGYDENGTLLFVYGDPNPANLIFQKSTLSYAGMSADIAFVQAIEADVEFGDVSFINPPASESIPGVSRRATTQQHIDGAATDVTATPAGIKATLDGRFGNGAPSAFVKGMLNLTTAMLFRAAIGVKDVATRDMGHGGGIDADLLDGKHANEFAPTTHSHGISAISGLQNALDGKAAAAHTHAISNVTGLQGALDGKAPSSHTHDGNDITGRIGQNAQGITDWNSTLTNGWFMAADAPNAPIPGWLIGEVVCHNPLWVTQTVWAFTGDHRAMYRRQRANGLWTAWDRCRIHESEQDARYPLLLPGYTSNANDIAGFRLGLMSSPSTNTPDGNWTTLLNLGGGDYITQIANPWFSDSLFVRAKRGGAWQSWQTVWSSSNFDPNAKANIAGAAFTGAVSAPSFNRTSSLRYKKDVRPIARDTGEIVLSLSAIQYRLIGAGDRVHFGVSAEQAFEIVPEVVGLNADGQPENVDYTQLVPVLIDALARTIRELREFRAAVSA